MGDDRIGPYRLGKPLGKGGMAEVFEAVVEAGAHEASTITRPIVLKLMRPELHRDERLVRLFLREAQLAARLRHENIVQVYDLGEDTGRFYLVMEKLDGLSWRDMARRAWTNGKSLDLAVVLRGVADAALGLDHAHSLTDVDGHSTPVVHRDVSPDNLMLCTDGATRVLDFGIAKVIGVSETLTATDEVRGKVPYMSPEQLGDGEVDARTDVWSLGVSLYWLLTGRSPFRGDSAGATMRNILTKDPAPPSAINRALPSLVDELALALLVKDRDKRVQTCAAVYERILALPMRAASSAAAARSLANAMELRADARADLPPGLIACAPHTLEERTVVEAAAPSTHVDEPIDDGSGFSALPTRLEARAGGDLTTQAPPPELSTLSTVTDRRARAHNVGPRARAPLPWAFTAASVAALALLFVVALGPFDVVTPPDARDARDAGDSPRPPPDPDHERGPAPTPEPTPVPAPADAGSAAADAGSRRSDEARRPTPPVTVAVIVDGGPRLRWSDARRLLRTGPGDVQVGRSTKELVATDPITGGRSRVPIVQGRARYDALPRGSVRFLVRPAADVVLGELRPGRAPIALSLPIGDYKAELVRDGTRVTKHFTVEADKEARVTHDFASP